MGHEVKGQVLALGPDAEGVSPGDLRVVYPWIGYAEYDACARYDDLLCLAVGMRRAARSSQEAPHCSDRQSRDTRPIPL